MIAYTLPIARLCLAIVFLYSGVDKLWHWRSSIEEVKSDGLPWPAAFAGATVFTQLVGGCLVATGFFAWLGALALAGFTVAATVLGHRFWLRRGAEFRHELTTSLEHVAIVGGLLLLSVLDFTGRGDENRKLCGLYLSIMDRMGVQLKHFGDADAGLAGL